MTLEFNNISYPPTDPDASLWKCMSFTDFIRIAECNGLHFSRMDSKKLYMPPNGLNQKVMELSKKLFMYSWNMNGEESSVMWTPQEKPTSFSSKSKLTQKEFDFCFNVPISIGTTFETLKNVLNDFSDEEINLGCVQYINEDKGFQDDNPYRNFFERPQEFRDENELRVLVHCDKENDDLEYLVPICCQTLVKSIFVLPGSPLLFEDLLSDILARYSLNIPVHIRYPFGTNVEIIS